MDRFNNKYFFLNDIKYIVSYHEDFGYIVFTEFKYIDIFLVEEIIAVNMDNDEKEEFLQFKFIDGETSATINFFNFDEDVGYFIVSKNYRVDQEHRQELKGINNLGFIMDDNYTFEPYSSRLPPK